MSDTSPRPEPGDRFAAPYDDVYEPDGSTREPVDLDELLDGTPPAP